MLGSRDGNGAGMGDLCGKRPDLAADDKGILLCDVKDAGNIDPFCAFFSGQFPADSDRLPKPFIAGAIIAVADVVPSDAGISVKPCP